MLLLLLLLLLHDRNGDQAGCLPHSCEGWILLCFLQQHHARGPSCHEGQAVSQQEATTGDTPQHAPLLCESQAVV
jgi:hypothetical protein